MQQKKKKRNEETSYKQSATQEKIEADLKYNSWRSLFLKTPLIELWLVWRD